MEMGNEAVVESETQSVSEEGVDTSYDAQNLDFLMDIPLDVTIELGRTNMVVKQLLSLRKNSVVELDREANEPIDILINNKRFARGEVVIEGEKIAIMITDIISPRERIQRLK